MFHDHLISGAQMSKIGAVCSSSICWTMIFDIIRQQVEVLRRPLAAVVLSTLPRRSSPLLLLLHWHGFAADETQRAPPDAVAPWPQAPLASSVLQLNQTWADLAQIDRQMLDAAWQQGAWNLVREVHRGCNVIGASVQEAVACRQAFGDNPFDPADETHRAQEAPDREALRDFAARIGYVRWLFRPVADGLWRGAGRDDSLMPDGRRPPPCPVELTAALDARVSRSVYQLGRIDSIVLL